MDRMKAIMRIFPVVVILCAFTYTGLYAEYLYLKDGQVIQGTIESEDAEGYTVKTKYQTKRIPRGDITRIMYGERKMEPIFLLMNDGSSKKGFLVDQDAEKIIIREKEDSPGEITVMKKDVRQISASEIVPLNPSVFVRAGWFLPLNSGGSKLKPAPVYFAGSDINFQYIANMRILLEAGYADCKSSNRNLDMRFVPLILSARYFYHIGSTSLSIIPGITAGVTLIDFNDGENSKYRCFAGTAGCIAGIGYEIVRNTFFVEGYSDYLLMSDRKKMLHTVTASLSFSYRFR